MFFPQRPWEHEDPHQTHPYVFSKQLGQDVNLPHNDVTFAKEKKIIYRKYFTYKLSIYMYIRHETGSSYLKLTLFSLADSVISALGVWERRKTAEQ